MSIEEKLEGMLLDGRRVIEESISSTGAVMMGLSERTLAHHAMLAQHEDDDAEEEREEEEELNTRALMSHDNLMPHEETVKHGGDQRMTHKLSYPISLPVNIKKEVILSEASLQASTENKQMQELAESPKKKKRKRRSPTKILTINEDGSLGLQSPKSHVCEHCSAAFRTNYHLQRHFYIHTGEKPFQCSQCDMRFIQKYLLQRHEKIHTGEKPFRCDECGMRFIQKYHMERHKRTHSGEKPYQCDYCHQFFSRTDRVLKHKRMCHENRDRKVLKATKDGMSDSSGEVGFSMPAKECSLPKKKRQKSSDRSRAPPTITQKVPDHVGEPCCVRTELVPLYAIASKVKDEYMVAEYSMEFPHPPLGSQTSGGSSPKEVHSPKLLLQKVSSKKSQTKCTEEDLSPLASVEDGKVTRYSFELLDKQDLLECNAELDPVETSKPAASSTNYDDAMQFLKKKRYLQAASSSSSSTNTRVYTLNVANMVSQASVAPATVNSVINHNVLDTQSIGEIKAVADKNVLPDEVLQTLLDHYSTKTNGQPDISFSVGETEVTSSISINSSQASQAETASISSPAAQSEKASMLQEYSKYLQQALERTSQNDAYLNQNLAFVTESQPLFSTMEKFSAARFRSPPRTAEKAHFGLLVGDSQQSFSFSGDETNASPVSPGEDFLDQVTPKKTDSQTFHITTFDPNFRTHFQNSRAQFSITNGEGNVRTQGASEFPEFPLSTITESRTQLPPSPDASSSQTFG